MSCEISFPATSWPLTFLVGQGQCDPLLGTGTGYVWSTSSQMAGSFPLPIVFGFTLVCLAYMGFAATTLTGLAGSTVELAGAPAIGGVSFNCIVVFNFGLHAGGGNFLELAQHVSCYQ